MQNLAAWVTQSGGGLMLTGGRDSLRLRRILQEPAGPAAAGLDGAAARAPQAVAGDRRGPGPQRQHGLPTPDGRAKIELADLATAEVRQHARADGPVRLHRRGRRAARDRARSPT